MRPVQAACTAMALCALWIGAVLCPSAQADTGSFSNPATIGINDAGTTPGTATPYPSSIPVAGLVGPISKVTLTLNSINQLQAADVDVLLVGPGGQTLVPLSDAASGGSFSSTTLTFDDAAPAAVPPFLMGPPLPSGTYTPTNYDNLDVFPTPAPSGPYGSALSTFNGTDPNGTWRLYVVDDTFSASSPPGNIAGGWRLDIATATPSGPPVDVPPVTAPTPPSSLQILSAGFGKPPVVGQPALLTVTARDPNAPVSGVSVTFDEKLGAFGETACLAASAGQQPSGPFVPGTPVTFNIPYVFQRAGVHQISVQVTSGGCVENPTTETLTFTVVVGPRSSGKASTSATVEASAKRAPGGVSSCPDVALLPTAANGKRVVKSTLCLLNKERAKRRLRPVKLNGKLGKAATGHSRDMVTRHFFAHTGPSGPSLPGRITRVRYKGAFGETLGFGAGSLGSPQEMVKAWMNSPPHKAIILTRRYRTVGIGVVPEDPKLSGPPSASYTADFGSK